MRFALLLRDLRASCDPLAIPGLAARTNRNTRFDGITQRDLGALTGVSEGWVRQLESGRHAPSADWIETVVRALVLDEGQRHSLYVYGLGHEPPRRCRPDASILDPKTEELVQQQQWTAYVSDFAWDVVTHNAAAGREWPWMRHGINVMVWALTYPEARIQLIDWEQSWAKPMAAQLRMRAEANPDHQRLAEVVAEIKQRDPGHARRILEEDLTTVHHPDGHRRLAYLPGQGDQVFETTFLCFTPMADQSLRHMIVPATPVDNTPVAA
ncbi:helix-turn-helix domain-containing protein [Streptomyces sp. UNOB3_S3]|uniref:MmyB family transcriptional regulator n=1 Tax=Streptomyces sp. UNOB3_S3 TaxID=2871682 RepID=UPI001E3C822C|nr:helix-turn-helix domain-containing protein [Streptomyces sp. UNOB3_S3]MCC3775181.1 helix-turn-helix transcriptional regulator [Streptomyces sp. UNOB3_S3]